MIGTERLGNLPEVTHYRTRKNLTPESSGTIHIAKNKSEEFLCPNRVMQIAVYFKCLHELNKESLLKRLYIYRIHYDYAIQRPVT